MALSPTAAGHAPDKRSPLPRWPGWRHLPREARDTLFLLGVIAWTVLPHAGHLPVWCSALTAAVLLWRALLWVSRLTSSPPVSRARAAFFHTTHFGGSPRR